MGPREVEERLLTAIATSGDIKTCISVGINEDWFTDPAARRGWKLQLAHYETHNQPGTLELYKAHSLGLAERFAPNDSIATLSESLRVSTLAKLTKAAASRFIEEVDIAEIPIKEAYQRLIDDSSSAVVGQLIGDAKEGGTLAASFNLFEVRAKKFEDNQGVVGIPYPWDPLNKVTGGQNGGDYIVWGGFRKARKTDIGCVEIAVHDAKECGETALIITDELSFEDMLTRVACRWSEVSYRRLRQGELTVEDWSKITATGDELKHHPDIHIEKIGSFGLAAIGEVRGLMDKYEPAVVCWDGHQLSAGTDEWKDVYQQSRRTRKLAHSTDIPIHITVQLNPSKREASFKAYHQDCTVFIQIEKDGAWSHCKTTEVREGDFAQWSMHCDRGLPLLAKPFGFSPDTENGNKEETVLG